MTTLSPPETLIEQVEVTINDFIDTTPPPPVRRRTVKVPHFADDVPEHLRNAYLLDDFIKSASNDRKLKRLSTTMSVKYDAKQITITEKRGKNKPNMSVTYMFDNPTDVAEFLLYFDIETMKEMMLTLIGTKIAGGSIIKTLIRGQVYWDKYYDVQKGPKTHIWRDIGNGVIAVCETIAAFAAIIILL